MFFFFNSLLQKISKSSATAMLMLVMLLVE